MTSYNKKICLIGDFGVGKTSLVNRFVNNDFSEEYQTTVGVSICTRSVELATDVSVKFVIWDIAGADRLTTVSRSYLSGANGCILVADGTRKKTIENALELKVAVDVQLDNPEMICLLNKHDLFADWVVDNEYFSYLDSLDSWQMTSARTGEGVEDAFTLLARKFLDHAKK